MNEAVPLPGAPASLAGAAPINRISLPWLRIQERKWLLGAVDAALAAACLAAAYGLWRAHAHPAGNNMGHMPWGWIVGGSIVWLLVSWLAGLYELETADRFAGVGRATITVGIVVMLLAFTAYYAFLKTYPRPALGLAVLATPVTVLVWRGLYARLLRRPASATRVLVVGNEGLCSSLVTAAAERTDYYRILGFVSEHPEAAPLCLGHARDLAAVATRFGAHRIAVAPRQSLSHELVAALSGCIERGVEVVDAGTAYEEIAGKVAVEHAGDYWLASLPTRSQTSRLEETAMRLLDIVGAVVGLTLTAVLTPIIALAIAVESGRPILYHQERVGRGGAIFTIYKFRSMRPDAEASGARWAARGDGRTTRIGRILRRTHLDELPQFWNVLRGDMSLVGPRPERPAFTEELTHAIPFYRLRLSVRPGLTGLKQIRVGYASTAEEHLEVLRHDLYYIKHRSVALNVQIIARTLGSVVGMDGR